MSNTPLSNKPNVADRPLDGKPKHTDPATARAERSDLSHFKRTLDDDEMPTRRRSLGINFRTLWDSPRRAAANIRKTLHLWHTTIKRFGRRIAAVVGVIVLLVIAVNIPEQLLRSSAFGMYEEGQYSQSMEEFDRYLEKRPQDQDARLYAAMAASRAGNFDRAKKWLNNLKGDADLADNPDYLFLHALLSTVRVDAIKTLNQLLVTAPENIEGRFLRAILLGSEQEFRRARDDFLQVDTQIRSRRDFNAGGLQAVHAKVSTDDSFISTFYAPPPKLSATGMAKRKALWLPLSRQINIPIAPDLYANQYAPALPENLLESGAEEDSIVGIYYTIMLLQAGEINEADVEFSKLPVSLMNHSKVGILSGVRDAITQNYAAAEKTFRDLSQIMPQEPIVFFNLANAAFYAPNPHLPQIAADLEHAFATGLKLSAGYHNRACLRLMQGDFAGALQDAETAMASGGLPQTPLVRLLAALAINPKDPKISTYLKAITDQTSPAYDHARLSYRLANGKAAAAYALLQEQLLDDKDGLYAQIYADHLSGDRLLRRARHTLQKAEKQNPQNPQIAYRLARNALALNDAVKATHYLNNKLRNIAGAGALADAVRGGIAQIDNQDPLPMLNRAIENATPDVRRQIAADFADALFATAPTLLRDVFADTNILSPIEEAIVARLRALDGDKTAAATLAQSAQNRDSAWPVLYHAGVAMQLADDLPAAAAALQAAANRNPANIQILARLYDIQTATGDAAANMTQQRIDNINRLHANPDSEKNQTPKHNLIYPSDKKFHNAINIAMHEWKQNPTARNPPSAALQQKIDAVVNNYEDQTWDSTAAESAEIYLQRGTFWMAIQDFAAAAADFQMGLKLAKENPPLKKQISEYLGNSLLVLGKYDQAVAIYRQLDADYPQFPLYRRLAGQALVRANHLKEAESYLQETLRLFPTDAKTYLLLAEKVYGKRHNNDKIVKVIRQAARAAPHHRTIYRELYEVLRTVGNKNEAKENSSIFSSLTPSENVTNDR